MDCQIQYDYLKAYLDFYIGGPDFKTARELSSKYMDYAVVHWREKFQEIGTLLAEFDGEEVAVEKEQEKVSREEEEQVSLKVEGESMVIKYSKTSEVQLFFYKVDLEVLFSINPSLLSDNTQQEDFMLLLPNHQFSLQLGQEGVVTVQIPE